MRRALLLGVVALSASCASEKKAAADDGDPAARAAREMARGSVRDAAAASAHDAAMASAQAVARCQRQPPPGEPEEAAAGEELIRSLVREPSENAFLQRLGSSLAAHSARPQLHWVFLLHGDEQPLVAWSVGGYVSVSRGAVRSAANEAELAAMLAHVIAHEAAPANLDTFRRLQEQRCLAEELSKMQSSEVPAGVAAMVGKPSSAIWRMSLEMGRRMGSKEDEYDGLALAMLEAEQLDLTAYLRAMDQLEKNPDWCAFHGLTPERRAAIEAVVKASRVKPKKPAAIPKELKQ